MYNRWVGRKVSVGKYENGLIAPLYNDKKKINNYCNVFRNALDCEYAQKYIALDGATPTMFGPRPLNRAREPSVCTINLEKSESSFRNELRFLIFKSRTSNIALCLAIWPMRTFHTVKSPVPLKEKENLVVKRITHLRKNDGHF